MDKSKMSFDSDKYKDEVDDYLKNAFDELVEPQYLREKTDPLEETVSMHIKRNELLLKEPQTHDINDQRASLYSQLLRIVREKRVNKYQNKGDEMRENIRQLFEINTQLQSILNQARNEVQKPAQDIFFNTKEFHDESYKQFLDDLAKHKNGRNL